MDFHFKDFIPFASFIFMIGGIIVTLAKAKGMNEVQQKTIDDKLKDLHSMDEKQWIAIDNLKEWFGNHEKDSSNYRIQIEKEFGSVRERIIASQGKLDEIINLLNGFKDQFSEMNKRLKDLEKQ